MYKLRICLSYWVYEKEIKGQTLYDVPSQIIAAQQTDQEDLLYWVFKEGEEETWV